MNFTIYMNGPQLNGLVIKLNLNVLMDYAVIDHLKILKKVRLNRFGGESPMFKQLKFSFEHGYLDMYNSFDTFQVVMVLFWILSYLCMILLGSKHLKDVHLNRSIWTQTNLQYLTSFTGHHGWE